MLTSYSLNLSIKPADDDESLGAADLLHSTRDVVRTWLEERTDLATHASEGSGEWLDPVDEQRERLTIIDESTSDIALFSLDWEHADRGGDQLRWRTQLKAATSTDGVELAIQLDVLGLDLDGEPIGSLPDHVRIDSPRIAATLVERFNCHFGTQLITNRVHHVDAADSERFTWQTIMNPERQLPVVVVSRHHGRHRQDVGGPALDCDRLARRLAGLADVALYEPDATWALGRMLGRRFPCFGGAVRVYLPEWSPDDDTWRHLLLKPDVVGNDESAAGQEIFEYCAKFASELPRYPGLEVIDNAEASAREARERARFRDVVEEQVMNEYVEPLLQRLSDLEQERSTLSNEINNLKKKGQATQDTQRWNQELEAENEQLNQTVRDLNDKVTRLQRANENLRAQLPDPRESTRRNVFQSATTLDDDGVDREEAPATMADVVRLASERFSRVEIMGPAARDALGSDFKRPAEVLGAFETLNDLGELLAAGGSIGTTIENWLEERGVRYSALESDTTMGKWGDERRVSEEGTVWEMQAHLKFGGGTGSGQNVLRVYLMWHETRWRIGRIVSHLTNTKT